MTDALPAPEDFRFTTTIDVAHDAVGFHVHNGQMTEFLFRARNTFLTEVAGINWTELMGSGRNLVIRQLTLDFVGEVREAQILMVGIRAASRRRRSLTLDEALWVAGSGQVVCRGRSIHIPVQIDPPGAIEVFPELLARLEEHEGRPIELVG
jgi:acyl-CoA thioesterase FadM